MDSEITRTLQSVPDAELLRRLAELVSQAVEPLEHRVELPIVERFSVGHAFDCTDGP